MKMMKNAIVAQSGGPTTAINASLAGVIKGCLESHEIDVLYGALNGVEGLMDERLVNLLIFLIIRRESECAEADTGHVSWFLPQKIERCRSGFK